jgi:hypothetical protein
MGRRRLARQGVWALAVVAIFATAAAADKPIKYEWPPVDSTLVLSDVCPDMVITVHMTATVTETDYFDSSGVPTRFLLQFAEQDTFVGPYGATLAGLPFRFSIHGAFDANGDYVRFLATGITEKVPLPDGGLFIGAGQIDWLPHLSDSGFILTPDHGATVNLDRFCAALGAGEP